MGASEEQRAWMVAAQLASRGIGDARVLEAFREVAREEFVSAEWAGRAYEDSPLPIGDGQTISQPYIVAVTAEALGLRGHERVLDVGTGSGYAAAILSKLAREVVTIERLAALADPARARLAQLGYGNVQVVWGDGTMGWPERAPYEAIAVAAGGPEVPGPLAYQLAIGGRLVMPVGKGEAEQVLVRVTRESETEFRQEQLMRVRFVPLIGERGWADAASAAGTAGTAGAAGVEKRRGG